LGLVTGSTIFANTGPPIKIVIVPVGAIDVDVMDEFVEAGINQTKHRIFLNIKTDLRVVVPLMSSTVSVSMQVPVTESIIIGPVPEWYMKFNAEETPAFPIAPPLTQEKTT
jgi:sporulation protein YunB